MARRCLDCGALCGSSRCVACKRNRKAARNRDAPLARALCATATHCARCGVELTHDQPNSPTGPTAQHRTALADGGTLTADAPVWCRSCNSAAGRN